MTDLKSATREKLDEAAYFLKQLKKNQSDKQSVQCNLSAFLSSARSVTYVMQSEFSQIEGFKEWYVKERLKLKKSQQMILLNEKRVITIHKKPIKPKGNVSINITESMNITSYVEIFAQNPDGTKKLVSSTKPKEKHKPMSTKTEIKYEWHYDDYQQQDVITISEEQLSTLRALVDDCEKQFLKK